MNDERLRKVLVEADTEGCLAFFQGMPEKERRSHFPQARQFRKDVAAARRSSSETGALSWKHAPVAEIAFFATATLSDIQKEARGSRPDDDSAVRLLLDRKPDWVDDWIKMLLADELYWAFWRLIRRLIQAGLARKPDSPNYYLGIITRVLHDKTPLTETLLESPDILEEDIWKLFEYEGGGENSLANADRFGGQWSESLVALMQQGKLSRQRLLDSSLAALERDFNHYRARWFHDFYDRLEPTENEVRSHAERYLGLLRASAPNVAAWAFVKVEQLAQTGCYDPASLSSALEPVLQARAKGTVKQALKLLEAQALAQPTSAGAISMIAATALGHEQVDVQNAALALLMKNASPEDAALRKIIEKYSGTLSASVSNRVAKWLGDDETQPAAKSGSSPSGPKKKSSSKSRAVPTPAKSAAVGKLPDQLRMLFALDALAENLAQGQLSIPAAIFDGTEIPRLALVQPLQPIGDLEELLDVCARVIEDGSLVDDVERCIDGLTRLCADGPPSPDRERMTGPLLKRTTQLIRKGSAPFCGYDPGNDILGLVYAFCTGTALEMKLGTKITFEFEGAKDTAMGVNMHKAIGFLSRRCQEIARRIARRSPVQLLSIPTHEQGWIDPRELVQRVNAWSADVPDAFDLVLAMLRLAPDNRARALAHLKPNTAAWVRAIRYALGADDVSVGQDAPVWVAAARCRSPWETDSQIAAAFPGLGPDAAEAAAYSIRFKKTRYSTGSLVEPVVESKPPPPRQADPLLVTVQMHSSRGVGRNYSFELGGFGGKTNGTVRWTSMIWPLARESCFAGAIQDCFENLDWSEAEWQNRTMLEPLLDPGTPLRYAGLMLLAGMLGAKEPGESGLATDIAIRAIDDGRLGSDNLGAALAELLPSQLIKPGRWQKTMGEVARASKVHAAVVQIALQHCFVGQPASLPKDYSKLLELLYELSVELELPIRLDACREFLENVGSAGKAGKLAKNLLALQANSAGDGASRTILEAALEKRLATASRFQRDHA